MRLTLDEAGRHQAIAASLPPNPPYWSYAISPERIDSGDALLRHKTSWRELYDREAGRLGADEAMFLNERGEVDGRRAQQYLRQARQPKAVHAALRPGLCRDACTPNCLSGPAIEVVLTAADLEGDGLFRKFLRGLIPGRP